MSKHALTYIVEYTPYAHRNERCALAILALLPDAEPRLVLADNLRKARYLNPACDLDELREGLHTLAEKFTSQPELLALYQNGFGGLSISTNPGYVQYESEDSLQEALKWQAQIAINPIRQTKPQRERATVSRLFLELKANFKSMGWLAEGTQGLTSNKIIPRYQLLAEEGLMVDFALRNGSLHYLQTIDYRHNTQAKRIEANAKLLTLNMGEILNEGPVQKYALIAGVDAQEAAAGIKLAERTADAIYVLESSEDMRTLMTVYGQAMGEPDLPSLAYDSHQ